MSEILFFSEFLTAQVVCIPFNRPLNASEGGSSRAEDFHNTSRNVSILRHAQVNDDVIYQLKGEKPAIQSSYIQHFLTPPSYQLKGEFGDLFVGLQWRTTNSPVLLLMCLCVSESTNVWSQYLLDHSLLGAIIAVWYACLDNHLGKLSRDLVSGQRYIVKSWGISLRGSSLKQTP